MADIFRAMGLMKEKAGRKVVDRSCYQGLDHLLEGVGIPAKLSDFGYREDHMETIIQETINGVQCQFNPQTPSKEDIVNIVKQLL